MFHRTLLAALSGFAFTVPPVATLAQAEFVWSDIDCAKSRIIAPDGLKCRATQNYPGGSANDAAAGDKAVFHAWSTYGTRDDVKLYYFLSEAMSPGTFHHPTKSLAEIMVNRGAQGDDTKNFSRPRITIGGDYITFTSSKGEAYSGVLHSCLGVRKLGPEEDDGYKWALYATRCVPGQQDMTEADAIRFLAETGYKP
jgi:hypothetical protein